MRSPTSPDGPTTELKPLLRGRIHQVAFFTAIPAGVVLVWLAPSSRARIGTLAFALAMVAQFGVSAMYHVGRWSQAQEDRMRRLDHSMIFMLIAGSYTPFCLLVLHGTTGTVVLAVVWPALSPASARSSTGSTFMCCRGSCTSGWAGSPR
ncbi:MAG: hemolysin III family protein [Actinomycetota bacterium]|nr:hemolysin III family protein [Actinomycetota bacterium]